MHLDRIPAVCQETVREIVDRRSGEPLVLIGGPSVDLAGIVEELDAYCLEETGDTGSTQIVHLSFAELIGGVHQLDRGPAADAGMTVLLVGDVHRMPPDVLPAFEEVVERLSGTRLRCVCTVPLPVPRPVRARFGSAFARLKETGLLRQVILRPLPRSRLAQHVRMMLEARPEPDLVTRLWELTRGWPGAVASSLTIMREHGLVRMVDRHAYLDEQRSPVLTNQHALVRTLHDMKDPVWGVAKAIAVLGPLGAAATGLVARALELAEDDVRATLLRLEQEGVLQYLPASSGWRFRIPVVAAALRTLLGPYERRELARTAVLALWSGAARCDDPHYLPDRLAEAGRMVDPERATAELLAAAKPSSANGVAEEHAIPWLHAAAKLTADRAERATILLAHARTCLAAGRADLALRSSDLVLRCHDDEIPDGTLPGVCLIQLGALYQANHLDSLEKVASGEWWPWPGTRLERAVCRAYALSLLNRWKEACELLEQVRRDEEAGSVAGYVRSFAPITSLWLGQAEAFNRDVAALPHRHASGEDTLAEVACHTSALLALGELRRAEQLLTDTGQTPELLGVPSRMIRLVQHGRVAEALELMRKALAHNAPNGCDAYQTVMTFAAATLQLCRGQLTRARELVTTARSRRPSLPHLLALAEASYAGLIGELDQARSIIVDALAQADDAGIVALTDYLWTALADLAVFTGATEALPLYLQQVDKIAAQLGTEQAEVHRLSLQALVHGDTAAAEAARQLLQRQGKPIEQATGIERLVRYGVAEPRLLAESYALYGDLGSLLNRARLRPLMQEHGVAVPGRQETLVENHHLLALLVTEGLSNKQIAAALCTSDKSVEGRLSRLFSYTGCRSRVELATAMFTGRLEFRTR
ncbi:LuxR C-terminal-related transcriptional regulator [Amycolatopsis sp. NEAU-NG30]|uniref:LuxR C-terminal-related transcriptional regulator n=1 Tax=Amycolatopsis melonis TaxID=3156488 RepID=A0ABV0LAP1_9PSEU